MFVELKNGTFISMDVVGHVTPTLSEETGKRSNTYRVYDKRQKYLGDIHSSGYMTDFWQELPYTIIPAKPGYKTIDFPDAPCAENATAEAQLEDVIAWKVYTDDNLAPTPVTIWGSDDRAAVLLPDGRVFRCDCMHDSIQAYAKGWK